MILTGGKGLMPNLGGWNDLLICFGKQGEKIHDGWIMVPEVTPNNGV